MEIILCRCAWAIPGVEQLPAHQHFTERAIRRISDGRTFTMRSHFIEQAGYEVLTEDDVIRISVDWKHLARVTSAT